jgi:large subunit ribosomal protein L1
LHVPIGKVSFETEQLYENFAALIDAVRRSRPASSKGAFFRTIVVTATMGPGIRVDPSEAISQVT